MMEVVSSDNWNYKSCKAPVKSSPPTNKHPVILQAGCPSCRPTMGASDPDPDPDPAGYPVNFVDPIRIQKLWIWLKSGSSRIQNVWIWLGSGSGPDPKFPDPDPAGSYLNTTSTE